MVGIRTRTVTVASGQTVSSAYNAEFGAAYEAQMPTSLTSTTMSFQTCLDTSIAVPIYQALYEYDSSLDDGSSTRLVAVAVAASRNISLPVALVTCQSFKCVMGSIELADRSIVIGGKAP